MTEMTNAQLTAEVDALAEQVRQMENLLALFMVNGLADAFDGSGNQTFGGGKYRLNPTGLQIKAEDAVTDRAGIYFLPAFVAAIDYVLGAPQPNNTQWSGLIGNADNTDNWIALRSAKMSGTQPHYASVMTYAEGTNSYVLISSVNANGPTASIQVLGGEAAVSPRTVLLGGLVLSSVIADYAFPYDGWIWYRSDLFRPRIRSNGITGNLGIEIQSATAPAVANNGTIATAGVSAARVAPAGAVTGVILAVGTTGGQVCTVINESVAANTVTFAAAGTSNVADGVASVIAGLTARRFVWDSVTALWYPTK